MTYTLSPLVSNSSSHKAYHLISIKTGKPVGVLTNGAPNSKIDDPASESQWYVIRLTDGREVSGWYSQDARSFNQVSSEVNAIPESLFDTEIPSFGVSIVTAFGFKRYLIQSSGMLVSQKEPLLMCEGSVNALIDKLESSEIVLGLNDGDQVVSHSVFNFSNDTSSEDIELLATEYSIELEKRGHKIVQDPDGSDDPDHLMWMLMTLKEGKGMSLTKRHRWLGFVQNALKQLGVFSVKAERDRTRSIFKGN